MLAVMQAETVFYASDFTNSDSNTCPKVQAMNVGLDTQAFGF